MKRNNTFYAIFFLAPSMLGFLLFFFLPFAASIYYSLMDSPVNGNFVGLRNYMDLLKNSSFLLAGSNTLLFTLISVPLIMAISLVFAIVLNSAIYFKNTMRTLFVSPLVIPVASVVLVWQIVFSNTGVVNGFLDFCGFDTVDWMNTGWARAVVIIVYLWKNLGYDIILFLAGLQNIPKEYYESSQIDGASAFRRFTAITLVYLTPTSFFIFVISIINSFKVFRETYLIAGSYPHESIYMLQHYMNNMFSSLDYQKLTTAAFIMALLITLLVVLLFKIERGISRALE
ncbi:MAG TPA: sugar ABC transporter permease [Clostridia bacterium]|nr:sugar ABC transporter permease [Clostridia bacterium]